MFCVPQRKGYRMANDFRFLMYNSPEEDVSINAVVKDETIWLSQKAMAELFDCSPDNISLHLKNIYSDGELSEKATAEDCKYYATQMARTLHGSHEDTAERLAPFGVTPAYDGLKIQV